MANAGGAWDNAKKIVEVELKEKGTPLHAATVVGDTVGDPFKDTSSVAMNPIIKFTTLFGLLAVELGVQLASQYGPMMSHLLAAAFIAGFGVLRVAVLLRDADPDQSRAEASCDGELRGVGTDGQMRETRCLRPPRNSLTLVFASDYNSRSCTAANQGLGGLSRAA